MYKRKIKHKHMIIAAIYLTAFSLMAGCSSRTDGTKSEKESQSAKSSAVQTEGRESDKAQETQPPEAEQGQSGEASAADVPADTSAEDEFLADMTLEEKMYQMFMVTPEQLTGVSAVTEAGETTKSKLAEHPVGGLIYFSDNLVSPEQTKTMLSAVQEMSNEIEGLPLFLGIDEEGGRISRLADKPEFDIDTVGAMADVSSAEEAYGCGDTIGAYLSELGFNVDFAPDADVITNSSNTVIGDRSFGADADLVTKYAAEYSDGLHSHNILSTFKHFPGHGATEADTHEGYAYTNKSYEELCEAELKPFAAAQENKVDFVMAAHISVPEITGDDTPCSLSQKMLTEILRGDLGYEGLIITDALNMGAIAEKYSPSDAAVEAVQAGVDILLMPGNLQEAYSGLYEAVQSGEITEDRIDESVRRILRVKNALLA